MRVNCTIFLTEVLSPHDSRRLLLLLSSVRVSAHVLTVAAAVREVDVVHGAAAAAALAQTVLVNNLCEKKIGAFFAFFSVRLEGSLILEML